MAEQTRLAVLARDDLEVPTSLFLLVGLPGAGRTTTARQLAAAHRALRLTPDEWMIPLFGDSEAGSKRDVVEGRLITRSATYSRTITRRCSASGSAGATTRTRPSPSTS